GRRTFPVNDRNECFTFRGARLEKIIGQIDLVGDYANIIFWIDRSPWRSLQRQRDCRFVAAGTNGWEGGKVDFGRGFPGLPQELCMFGERLSNLPWLESICMDAISVGGCEV